MEKNEYKLIIPNNSGKQYLTFVGADIYYHGNINKIAIASKRVS
jgi:hypothetical protein